ncbi:RNA-binding protein 5 isoform X2 [Amia ocellicauda]|uniref:RNA-binding protein 5 isoform X2 n=1 Tax=Amia ocellicauda TaxID=2972642 RepID=UPI003463BF0E
MWDGPRSGPRGPPFRGNHHGEMFDVPKRPFPEFRGRDQMHMGFRPNERPPMDTRLRHEHPPDMRGRNLEPLNMRGGDPHMDFLRQEKNEFGMERRHEMEMRNRFRGPPDFRGPARHPLDIGGRDRQPVRLQEFNESLMDLRDRERYPVNMPGFDKPPVDSRRRPPLDILGREGHTLNMRRNDEGFGELWDSERPRMGVEDVDGLSMDLPQRDFERRGVPPVNVRGRFDSDMDFRERHRPPAEFRENEESPLGFRDNDGVPLDGRGRAGLPKDLGCWNGPKFRGGEGNFREFREQRDPPVGFRTKPIADEWHPQNIGERDPFPMEPQPKGCPPFVKGKDRISQPRGRERVPGQAPEFPGREGNLMDFHGLKEGPRSFAPPEREAFDSQLWKSNAPFDHIGGRELPPFGHRGPKELPVHPAPLLLNSIIGEEAKGGPKDQEKNGSFREKPAYFRGSGPPHGKETLAQEHCSIGDLSAFPESKELLAGPELKKSDGPEEYQGKKSNDFRDQDYRDIDYRLASSHTFDYEHGEQQGLEKPSKEPKPVPPPRSSDLRLQDQDYRSASLQEKVSKTISVTGIPKTATMEQILSAFAVRDGVPMQGMKIRNVVPGYSYDTAYVEFLNLEDAVHFMESNQGSLKIGSKNVLMQYIQIDWSSKNASQSLPEEPKPVDARPPIPGPVPAPSDSNSPEALPEDTHSQSVETFPQNSWVQTPQTEDSWQQPVDQQSVEPWGAWSSRPPLRHMDPIFKESKTMIIKNVKPTCTVETILKALDPFAYLDERNVRLVRGKPMGSKCFCFVDMDSHEQVVRLVELLTKPQPLIIDGARVHVEVARPLKNQSFKKDFEKMSTSLLGYPDLSAEQQQYYSQTVLTPIGIPAVVQGDSTVVATADGKLNSDLQLQALNPHINQLSSHLESAAADQSYQPAATTTSSTATGVAPVGDGSGNYDFEAPDVSTYLYDATSGFYYDPQTTLYYDPNSRYFYNAETQQYLYWDNIRKDYVPVPGYTTETQPPAAQLDPSAAPPAELPSEAQQDKKAEKNKEAMMEKKEEEAAGKPEKKEKEKDDKPRSLAAHKIMKDMERWAKIQNRQKESVRAPSPVLKPPGISDERKTSKAADAAFAIFERKRPLGSLGMLVSEYGAGSDEEEEDEKKEEPRVMMSPMEKEDKLTDWKKMACLLCRRQFPNKDALVRHQKLSDLHKQNMEIHLKIKRSKRELEALETQEREMNSRDPSGSPEAKRKKYQGSGSFEVEKGGRMHRAGGMKSCSGDDESFESPKKKKGSDMQVRTPATYREAVRKAMFARYKELE